MAGLLLFMIPARKRRVFSLLMLLLVAFAAGTVGCGGGTMSAGTTGGTPSTTAGSYTFTVKGTDSINPNITATSTVTVSVE